MYFKSNYSTSLSKDKQLNSNAANIFCKESSCDKNLPTFEKQTESKNRGENLSYLPAWLVIVRREQVSYEKLNRMCCKRLNMFFVSSYFIFVSKPILCVSNANYI